MTIRQVKENIHYTLPIGSIGIERAKRKRPIWIRIKEWFVKQNEIEYRRALPNDIKSESLAETMALLEKSK